MEKTPPTVLILLFLELLISLSQITCITDNQARPAIFLPSSKSALKTTTNSKKHFLLVHGAGHGAWCWYKLTALLETAGHDVTPIDLAGSGISPKQVEDVRSVQDYAEPLMDAMKSIPFGEKVVVVVHSLGCLPLALAMEAFPEKISVAVFLAAVLIPPNSTLHEFLSQRGGGPSGCLYDTKISFDENGNPMSIIFGPQMLTHRLYQQCPFEDLKLATVLVRETRIFTKENTPDVSFTNDRYGSVPRVFAFGDEDKLSNKDDMQAMIDKAGVDEVRVIEGADHMVMLSKPQNLFSYLLQVAEKYA